MTSLEHVLAKVATQNDLKNISITLYARESMRFSVSVQWDGFARDGINCSTGHGPTAGDALDKALAAAAIERLPLPTDHELDGATLTLLDAEAA